MIDLLICGAGSIGKSVATFFSKSDGYRIHLADISFSDQSVQRLLKRQNAIVSVAINVQDEDSLSQYILEKNIQAVISCLPSHLNPYVARVALKTAAHYFDLCENETIQKQISLIAKGAQAAFVPCCGLSPGITGIIAYNFVQAFDVCDFVNINVGTLTQNPKSFIDYAKDCSIDRIMSKYTNQCTVLRDGIIAKVEPFSNLGLIYFDHQQYEAFSTSGCLGSLISLLEKSVLNVGYKSIHYKGYCDKFHFLLNDLKLGTSNEILRDVLNHAKQTDPDDEVFISVSVVGKIDGRVSQKNFEKRCKPARINGYPLSAFQASTAVGVCVAVDEVMQHPGKYKGLVHQETFSIQSIFNNEFFSCYFGRAFEVIQ